MLDKEEPRSLDPFHDDNVQQFILLTLLQIRDFMAVAAGGASKVGYDAVREAHKRGELMLEWPTLKAGADAHTD